MRKAENTARCATCGRLARLTFHHLIPRKLHRRKRFQRLYTRDTLNRGIAVCPPCHRGIHRRFSEMELGTHYTSLEALQQDEDLQRHFAWVARQKVGVEGR
jgi:regulation of enolase protein 1 (concanavalin A-like superfamily)